MQPIFWHRKKKEMFKAISINFYHGHESVGYYPDIVMDPDNYEEAWLDDIDLRWPAGLRDKNGSDIYEGDVVKGKTYLKNTQLFSRFIGEVKYFSPAFRIDGVRKYKNIREDLNGSYEIIGNIYENPELIDSAC